MELITEFADFKKDSTYKFILGFTNTGDGDLIIKNVVGNCGCMSTKWPTKAIRHLDSNFILTNINIRDTGNFIKLISVYSNDSSVFDIIKIHGFCK